MCFKVDWKLNPSYEYGDSLRKQKDCNREDKEKWVGRSLNYEVLIFNSKQELKIHGEAGCIKGDVEVLPVVWSRNKIYLINHTTRGGMLTVYHLIDRKWIHIQIDSSCRTAKALTKWSKSSWQGKRRRRPLRLKAEDR